MEFLTTCRAGHVHVDLLICNNSIHIPANHFRCSHLIYSSPEHKKHSKVQTKAVKKKSAEMGTLTFQKNLIQCFVRKELYSTSSLFLNDTWSWFWWGLQQSCYLFTRKLNRTPSNNVFLSLIRIYFILFRGPEDQTESIPTDKVHNTQACGVS